MTSISKDIFFPVSEFLEIPSVKWGKEQPKITNLALTPQPRLLEMKLICQLTGATSENHL